MLSYFLFLFYFSFTCRCKILPLNRACASAFVRFSRLSREKRRSTSSAYEQNILWARKRKGKNKEQPTTTVRIFHNNISNRRPGATTTTTLIYIYDSLVLWTHIEGPRVEKKTEEGRDMSTLYWHWKKKRVSLLDFSLPHFLIFLRRVKWCVWASVGGGWQGKVCTCGFRGLRIESLCSCTDPEFFLDKAPAADVHFPVFSWHYFPEKSHRHPDSCHWGKGYMYVRSASTLLPWHTPRPAATTDRKTDHFKPRELHYYGCRRAFCVVRICTKDKIEMR